MSNGEKLMNSSDENIALILDELSNKVIGYKTFDFYSTDILVDKVLINFINETLYNGQDVYFINGELIACEKDPNEFNNRVNNLEHDIAETRKKCKSQMSEYIRTKSHNSKEMLQKINKKKQCLINQRNELEERRCVQMKDYLLQKLKNHCFKYYCSICLIIRDESEYLKEWLEWHIGQGVEHFYIYDHGSKQPIKDFINTLDLNVRSKITLKDFSGEHSFAQHEAYNDCLKRYGKESRWIGFLDTDEMARVKNGLTIPELLREYEDYAGLFIRWIVYDANGQRKKNNTALRARFTHITPYKRDYGMGKVFVQPLLIKRMITHNGFPIWGFNVVDEQKDPIQAGLSFKMNATDNIVCVDHYYTKSYEEWVEKIKRGSCDPLYSRKYSEFFDYNPDMGDCREDLNIKQIYEISNK